MYALYIVSGLLALVASEPCDPIGSEHSELLLSLNKKLLRSLEDQETFPNPSVHLALRLSTHHNLGKESDHLNALKTDLHNDIESSLANSQPVVGLLALYTLALKASCYDLNTLTFTVNQRSETLLTHLKRQMALEKEHITFSHRPLTNYYQYSLGVLALCVSGVRVNSHVSKKLVGAVDHGHIKHGDSDCIDTFAMAGMALQCLKESDTQVQDAALDKALGVIKQKLLDSRRADGHMGNEFSTGLAVQALLAMGSQVQECSTSMEAMRSDVRKGTYRNPMAMSQILPALQQKTYLQVKGKQCRNEDDSLVLEARQPVMVLQSNTKVALKLEVVKSHGAPDVYSVDVPTGTSLVYALELLQKKNIGFTFEKETSLWGPFLSVVNGERARQTDRRYWRLSSDGNALSQGINDFKIEMAQKITLENTSY
ncbi:transcobalamin-2 isoform X1 [Salvelinus fontinalis]|uniref:transcobalamin-2 isoform X1 n=1 Tax=Salvelinus fontinalis TaxID=8038 RepID=UPI0024856A9D|nr:transcobalamin-2 isoform X1 [Salvelinus fontinalis]